MAINWKQKGESSLLLETGKTIIEFYFDDTDCLKEIYIGCQTFDWNDDTAVLESLYAKVEGNLYSLNNLGWMADDKKQAITAEDATDAKIDAEHINSMSAMGRYI